MNQQEFEISLLFVIVPPRLAVKAEEVMRKAKVPEQYHSFAKGTATGEIINLLGLGDIDKTLILSLVPRSFGKKLLNLLRDELYLGTPGSGVAFISPVTGASRGLVELCRPLEKNPSEKGESMKHPYSMVLALVNQGFSEDVMAAARKAGAGGGTVFHSRRVGSQEALQFWGISIQEEREIVLILATDEQRLPIMRAITEKCGADSDAHGLVISLPVEDVAGIKKKFDSEE